MSAELRLVRVLAGAALRRHAASVLSVAVLIALLGGLAMGSVAAARRTQDAYPAYLSGSRASNLQVFPYSVRNRFGFVPVTELDRIFSRLPLVTHVAVSPSIYVVPSAEGNDPAAPFNATEVEAVGSEGGEWFTVDRPAVVSGRMANPADPTEMVASKDAVALLHWHLGERVRFNAYTAAQASTSLTSPRATRHLTLRLVGIVVFANEVARDDVDRYPTQVVVTPALTRTLASSVGNVGFSLVLRGGDASVPVVEHEVQDALPPDSVYEFHVTSVVETAVEHAIEPASLALAAFGAFAAAACLVLAYQALRRLVLSEGTTIPVARALGASRRSLVAAAALPGVVAIVAGAAAAVAIAVLASPLAPIGAVRDVDPAPGLTADGLVLGSGVALVVLVLGVAAARLGAATLRQASRPAGSWTRSRPGEAAARAGAPLTVVTGVRFALERNAARGSSTYAVLVASVLAVAVAVATVTFGSSLRTLTTDPRLYGWNWDYAIISPADSTLPPAIGQALSRDPDVAGWAGYIYASVEIAGTTVPLDISATTDPAVGPTLLAGHGIDGPRQVVLGAQTMASVHAHVGGWVVASYGSPSDYPVYVPPTRVRVVGEATMPAIGATDNLHTSMGVGATLSASIEPPAFRAAITQPDRNLDGPNIVVVRLRPGVRRAVAEAGSPRSRRRAPR